MNSNHCAPRELIHVLRQARSFAVVGHIKPDADTLGSSLALASLVRRIKKGRRVVLANATLVPGRLHFLPEWNKIIAPAKRADLQGLDCAVYLECARPERAGDIAVPSDFRYTVNIDHHKTGRGFAMVNWINPKASSNSEQVYLLFREFGLQPSQREAYWLYAGIIADTGRFQYSLTSPRTHEIAARLLETGIPHSYIAERLFTVKEVEHLKLLSKALSSMEFCANGRIAILMLTAKDFGQMDYHATQTEDIVNYGLAPEGVAIAALLKEEPFRGPATVAVSLRSRGKFDISSVAVAFGGGGHANAAGFEVAGVTPQDLKQRLVKLLTACLPS